MRLFETMLVAGGRVVDLEEHYERMRASAVALGLSPPEWEAFGQAEACPTLSAVRVVYDGHRIEATAFDIPPLTLERRENARAITLTTKRVQPEHKLLDFYDVSRAGLRRAEQEGANEGLFVDDEGRILEGTATNVFAVRGRTLITANDGVLPGIVRRWVLDRAPAVELRAPTIAEVRGGAFLTGSLTGLAPLRMLNGERCVVPGEVFEELRLQSPHFSKGETA